MLEGEAADVPTRGLSGCEQAPTDYAIALAPTRLSYKPLNITSCLAILYRVSRLNLVAVEDELCVTRG